jgi:hypothetical protein
MLGNYSMLGVYQLKDVKFQWIPKKIKCGISMHE